jgi:hypothetical protein
MSLLCCILGFNNKIHLKKIYEYFIKPVIYIFRNFVGKVN